MKNMPKLRFHLIFFYHKTEDWEYLFKEIGKVSTLLYARTPYNFIDKILIYKISFLCSNFYILMGMKEEKNKSRRGNKKNDALKENNV